MRLFGAMTVASHSGPSPLLCNGKLHEPCLACAANDHLLKANLLADELPRRLDSSGGSWVLKNLARACSQTSLYFIQRWVHVLLGLACGACLSAPAPTCASSPTHRKGEKRALVMKHAGDACQARRSRLQIQTPRPSHEPDSLDAALTFGCLPAACKSIPHPLPRFRAQNKAFEKNQHGGMFFLH